MGNNHAKKHLTTTTLPTLESHLWEAINILRDSPVDRADWKSFILPFIFFKRINDLGYVAVKKSLNFRAQR